LILTVTLEPDWQVGEVLVRGFCALRFNDAWQSDKRGQEQRRDKQNDYFGSQLHVWFSLIKQVRQNELPALLFKLVRRFIRNVGKRVVIEVFRREQEPTPFAMGDGFN
jgi:hypothetical protein